MGTPLRFIPDSARIWTNNHGENVAIVVATVRCIQARHLLRPSERARSLILGILGRAQERFGFELYAYQFLSNHFDLMFAVRSASEQARILHFINTNLSKELGRPELSDWPGRMFERRPRCIPILDGAALIDRFRYILAHGVKEGLVKHCSDWPGAHCARPLCEGRSDRGIWVDRTELWRRSRLAENQGKKASRQVSEADVSTSYVVTLSKIPCWAELSDARYRTKVKALCREILEETAATRELLGAAPASRTAVLADHPHFRPETAKRSPAPMSYCKDTTAAEAFVEEYRLFCVAYRAADSDLLHLITAPDVAPRFPSAGVPPGSGWARAA